MKSEPSEQRGSVPGLAQWGRGPCDPAQSSLHRQQGPGQARGRSRFEAWGRVRDRETETQMERNIKIEGTIGDRGKPMAHLSMILRPLHQVPHFADGETGSRDTQTTQGPS